MCTVSIVPREMARATARDADDEGHKLLIASLNAHLLDEVGLHLGDIGGGAGHFE